MSSSHKGEPIRSGNRGRKVKPETAAEIEQRAATLVKTAAVIQAEAIRLYAKAAQLRSELG